MSYSRWPKLSWNTITSIAIYYKSILIKGAKNAKCFFFYSIFSASNDKNTSTSNMLNPKIFSNELQRFVINNSSLWLDCIYIYFFNLANDSFSHFCFSLLSQFSILCNYGPSWVVVWWSRLWVRWLWVLFLGYGSWSGGQGCGSDDCEFWFWVVGRGLMVMGCGLMVQWPWVWRSDGHGFGSYGLWVTMQCF